MIEYVADRSAYPELQRFFLTEGRMPYITDAVKPWEYRGWLLQQVQLAHFGHPGVVNRWGYWMDCIEAGRILPVPIPQLEFAAEGDPQVRKGWDGEYSALGKLLAGFERIESVGGWDDFQKLVDWLAWGLGQAPEPPRMSPQGNEFLYRNFDFGPWLLLPADYLGSYLCERRGKGWNPAGFYPTPMNITMMMSAMVSGTSPHGGRGGGGRAKDFRKDMRAETTLDCCVGSGRMLLAAANYSLRLYGQDIDPLVVKICLINGALYVPWMVAPFPESFFAEPLEEIPEGAVCPYEKEGAGAAGRVLLHDYQGMKDQHTKRQKVAERERVDKPMLAALPEPPPESFPEVVRSHSVGEPGGTLLTGARAAEALEQMRRHRERRGKRGGKQKAGRKEKTPQTLEDVQKGLFD